MLRSTVASFALATASVAGPPIAAISLIRPDGTFDIAAAAQTVAAAAPCPIDPRDLLAISAKESASAVVHPGGKATTPDGAPIRGDQGRSYGPFQFNEDAGTWRVYGNGGDPDNWVDAAAATTRMLCANNYAADRMAAIARHNGSGPAARAYADHVDQMARELPPLPATPAPAGAPAGDPDCGPKPGESRYNLGAFASRVWCNAVVRPWLALAERGEHKDKWAAADKWIFGPDAGPSPGGPLPTGTKSAGGITCPVAVDVVVGDGWGASRGGGTRGHEGIDLFGPIGSPNVAPFSGTVIDVQHDEGAGGNGGRHVVLRATGGRWDGWEVYMAHLDRVDVTAGQAVKEGQQVGTVGNTGNARSGDPHTHLQIYEPGGGAPVPAGPTVGAACGHNPDAAP